MLITTIYIYIYIYREREREREREFQNYSFILVQEVENVKTNIFHYGKYGPWRQFLMLGLFKQKVVTVYYANYSNGIHRNCSNARPLAFMHAVHRRAIDCRVHSKISGMSAMVPAATVILSTRFSSVSTTVSYTRLPGNLASRLWFSSSVGTWSCWCTKPLWTQKKNSTLELPSLLVPLRTCQESSNGHDNQWSDDVLRATGQWSRIGAVPVNVIALSLALKIAVRDLMYQNEITYICFDVFYFIY